VSTDEPLAFHAGEQAMQARTGMATRMAEVGARVIRDFMLDQHRELFAELPLLLVGTLDEQGQPWANMITGAPGFVASPDARTLRIHGPLHPLDPLASRLQTGAPLGVLGIQLETRRRNRMNGRVVQHTDRLLEVQVAQSFGNCPKYIHARAPSFRTGPGPVSYHAATRESATLSAAALRLVRQADTFFVASASAASPEGSAAQGVDVSHRGGARGFVEVEQGPSATVLTAPDYVGNFFFNTLGNLALYPQAGLLFANFDTGDVLTLTVAAELVFESEALARHLGAQRLTRFRVREGWLLGNALPLRFTPRRG